jgi:hypothetical protein
MWSLDCVLALYYFYRCGHLGLGHHASGLGCLCHLAKNDLGHEWHVEGGHGYC